MNSLNSRIRRIETGIDVARLSREQVRLLDISRLSLQQIQSLDIRMLTDEQVVRLDLKDLTDAQVSAVNKGFDEKYPKMGAVIRGMTDEELTAVKEWRLCPWHPGCAADYLE